jgi:hypothetical protein
MDYLTDYFYKDMMKQEAMVLKEYQEIGCPVCGSHNMGWIKIEEPEDWSPMEYMGCLNCIEVRKSFTTA